MTRYTTHVQGEVLSPFNPAEIMASGGVNQLKNGPHRLTWGLRAWFFDMEEIRRGYGYRDGALEAGAPWLPLTTDSAELYGPERRPWAEYWAELRARFRAAEVESLTILQGDFQLMDELPPGYPAAIRSAPIDSAVRASLRMGVFYCPESRAIVFWDGLFGKTPVPIAGVASLRDEHGTIVHENAVYSRGDVEGLYHVMMETLPSGLPVSTAKPVRDRSPGTSRDGGVQRSSYLRLLAALENGDEPRVTIVFTPSRSQAVHQGFDSYWGGTVRFEGRAFRLENCTPENYAKLIPNLTERMRIE